MDETLLGWAGLVIGASLVLTEIWLIYMVNHYTERAKSMLPESHFVNANSAAYAQAGFVGMDMRNGFLTLVLVMPGLCAKRGILDIKEARDFPQGLKRILFVSWGLGFALFSALMVFGAYVRFSGRVASG